MNERIFLSGYALLFTGVVIGFFRYKRLDKHLRLVLLLLSISLLTEMTAYISVKAGNVLLKGIVYHAYSIVEILLIGYFFLSFLPPRHYRKLAKVHTVLWPVLGVINVLCFQKAYTLNTNILMLESFSIITMCLAFIYWLLKNDVVNNIFRYPPFWVTILWLVLWSGTFCFWAFIGVLHADRWKYTELVISMQGVLLLLVYFGFCLIFFFHPNKLMPLEHR